MPSRKIRVVDFQSLQQEKIRLRAECRILESQLDQQFTHLRENFGSMAFQSILPEGSLKWTSLAGKMKDLVLGLLGNAGPQSFATGAVSKGLQMLFARQLIRLMTRSRKEK
ncbi:MAG TPA: hypothetical protein VMV20_05540 [Chitinophagaceae bacterium]|nr:hypothetical protein [Chitinophagaceae bacterium]